MDKKFISRLINSSQERIVWYKKQLEDVYRSKELYPDWYKEFLRDCKNTEMNWLKSLQEESYWSSIN